MRVGTGVCEPPLETHWPAKIPTGRFYTGRSMNKHVRPSPALDRQPKVIAAAFDEPLRLNFGPARSVAHYGNVLGVHRES